MGVDTCPGFTCLSGPNPRLGHRYDDLGVDVDCEGDVRRTVVSHGESSEGWVTIEVEV